MTGVGIGKGCFRWRGVTGGGAASQGVIAGGTAGKVVTGGSRFEAP